MPAAATPLESELLRKQRRDTPASWQFLGKFRPSDLLVTGELLGSVDYGY
jgi:hypothetical protein